MTNLNADAGTDTMAAELKDAAGDLEQIAAGNQTLRATFEGQGWGGLDILESIRNDIDGVRDGLVTVAVLIGVGGQIVRDAHLNNHMITRATKESLGHS